MIFFLNIFWAHFCSTFIDFFVSLGFKLNKKMVFGDVDVS